MYVVWPLLTALLISLTGCATHLPHGVQPVTGFDVARYLGRWHEIARLEHRFERGLTQVTADYQRRDDGGIRVINRGFDAEQQRWQSAEGRAYFVQTPDIGHLKVSFFGPFYSSYVILALDQRNYQYALVTGPDRDYLWLLARQPQLADAIKRELVDKARSLGYPVEQLLWLDTPPAL
ncbi:MAG: lipocalin family protein [Methylococcales bacterium]|nr:lipocalin family protein [Methylococcales bacterium]